MKKGAWKKKKFLLLQREQLCMENPADFADRIKKIDEALAEEEARHRLAVQRFKMSRKTWNKVISQNAL